MCVLQIRPSRRDHERCRQPGHRSECVFEVLPIVAVHDRVVHLELLRERLGLGELVEHHHADDFEALRLVAAVEIHEARDLDFARAAPGRPEVQEQHLAAVVGQPDGASVDILEREVEVRFLRVNRTGGRVGHGRRVLRARRVQRTLPGRLPPQRDDRQRQGERPDGHQSPDLAHAVLNTARAGFIPAARRPLTPARGSSRDSVIFFDARGAPPPRALTRLSPRAALGRLRRFAAGRSADRRMMFAGSHPPDSRQGNLDESNTPDLCDARGGARGLVSRDRAAGGCPAGPSAGGGQPGAGRAGRPRRPSGEVAGGRRRPARHVPPSRAERQRGGGVGRREAAADAEGRTGPVERHERPDAAGDLHLLARRGRRHDERPGEPAGADVVRQFPEHVHGAGPRGVASGAGRPARRDRASRVPFRGRQRRPRLLRLHAARLRRAPGAAVPGPVPPARSRRRCRAVAERRRGAPTTSSTI